MGIVEFGKTISINNAYIVKTIKKKVTSVIYLCKHVYVIRYSSQVLEYE